MNIFIYLAISVIMGIALFSFLINSAVIQITFFVIVLLILSITLFYFKSHLNSVLLMLCFIFCGLLSSFISEAEKNTNFNTLKNFSESQVTAKAEITEVISIKEKIQIFHISITELENENLKLNSNKSYNLLLYCPSGKKYLPGDKVSVKGTFSRIHALKNFKIKSYEDYMSEKGYLFQIKSNENPELLKYKTSIKGHILKIKQKIIKQMTAHHSKENCSLVAGITFGDKTLITPKSEELFLKTGTIHLLAASGLNISIILLPILLLSKKLKMHALLCAMISLPLIICYIYMANCSPSIIRAGIMSFIAIIVLSIKKEYNLINSLFLTILIMSLQTPSIIYNIGFQLSSLAVTGIWIAVIFIMPKIKTKNIVIKYILNTVILSLCIEAITAPVIAYYFCQYTPWSALGNLILVPLSTIMLYLGITESIIAVVCPQAFFVCVYITDITCIFIFYCQELIGALPFSFISISPPNIFILVIYFLTLSYFLVKHDKYKILIIVFPQILFLICQFTFPSNAPFIKLTFFDVGNGDSCLIESDNGKKILIDTGGGSKDGRFNAGEDIIIPFLLKSNIKKLDLVLISHSDNDHCGGLEAISKKIKIDKILKNTKGIEVPQKIFISKNLDMDILWPKKEIKERNDSSLVIGFNYTDNSILFCGDISSDTEIELLKQYEIKNINILKVPHHGSKTSSCKSFIKTTSPEFAVISTGYKNKYGHPHTEVLSTYKKYAKNIMRTDIEGAIQIKIYSNGIKTVRTARLGKSH